MKNIDLSKIPIKIVVPVLGVIVILFLYLYYFYIPYSKKINDLKIKISKLEADVNQAKLAKAKYQNLNKKLDELNKQKAELEKKIPKDKNLPEVIKTIKTMADKYGVSIRSISSTSAVGDGYFFRVTYNISVVGSYHDIGMFFAAISLNERIFNVENVTITGGDPSNVNFVLVSYQYGG
jgi:type IV pilus assembly protein PilO